MANTSYYLYQKWEKRGEQDWIPVYPNEYSIDANETMPLVVKAVNDPTCGYIPPSEIRYRWVNLDPSIYWICDEVPPIYRWQQSGYTCVGYDKYQNNIKQVSYDSGTTWENVSPAEYSATTLIEQNSDDCGYVPPQPTFDGKFIATYTGGTTYSASCDGNVTLTSGNTRPNGYTYTAMTDAVIGNCVTGIGEDAFYNCKTLTSVTIPDSVTSIGWDAFGDCYSLTSVTIPDSVTSIGDYTFYNCNRLTSIIIPSGVTSIGEYIFYGCYGLTSVTIPDSVTSIGRYAFYWCTGLTSVTIPSGVTSIGNSAFRICSSLTSVTIPSSVTSIDIQAFRNCSSLTSITCLATAPAVLGSNAFDDTNNCPIYVPAEQVEEYKDIWSRYADRIQAIPNS